MAHVISEKTIKKAKKLHDCNACLFLQNHVEENRHDLQMKFSEVKAYLKAKQNNFQIQIGESYLSQFLKDSEGAFYVKSIPAIHEICFELGLYDE
jgi:chromosomal replication initiation ATPase DnaA